MANVCDSEWAALEAAERAADRWDRKLRLATAVSWLAAAALVAFVAGMAVAVGALGLSHL